jgi:hypothetical protein
VTPAQEELVYRLVRIGADLTTKNKDKIAPRYFASRHYKTLLTSTLHSMCLCVCARALP